jgi:thiamine kinase-like enzyme
MADTICQLAKKKGINWSIKDLHDADINLPKLASIAEAIVQPLQDKAVVHGDVHLRNVLLRDNRDPFLIDYALSGPGHPCYDLARLDAAVMFRCFRAVAPEPRVAAFIAAISIENASYADLEQNYRDLLTSVGNRIAAKTSILVRKQCLDLLTGRGANAHAYYAMKVLVSASALTMLEPQSAICRATLSALAPLLS